MLNQSLFCLHLKRLFWLMIFILLLWAPSSLFADQPTPGCPLTSVNGAADTCYTVTPPPGTVTIDGILTGTEWNGAPLKNLCGDFSAKIRFKRDGNNLHFLISVNDIGFNGDDRIELSFDPLHNHTDVADEITFLIRRQNTGHQKKSSGGPPTAWTPAAIAIKDGSCLSCPTSGTPPDFSTGWAAEVTINETDLGASDLPSILGFSIQVHNQDTGDQTSWPSPFPASATTWANLKTRYPIEYMIALDQSGSMLSQNKWDNAKKAANFLANTMAIFRDATYFNDKLGVVTFSWNNAVNTDQTTTPKPLASISAFPLGNYCDAAPAVSPPLSNYWTPIGKGLDASFTAVGTGVEETERVVLLLSDGLHNRPTSDVPLLPTHLSYNPCGTATWTSCTNSNVTVNTVAFGQPEAVDEALLTNIKTNFAGVGTTYNISSDPEDLKDFFISSLDELYQMNLAFSGGSGTEFTVNAGERKLIVILSWTTATNATTFSLQQKVNVGDPWSNVSCNVSALENSTVGYAICVVNEPPGGTWRAVDGTGNPLTTADRQFVLLDLKLRARFGIDQKVHGTGQDIVLTADLKEAGLPVTHDSVNHPVEVTVNIKRPGEGFGTYVSMRTLNSCEPRPPQLPPIHKDLDLMKGSISPSTFVTAVSQPTNIDLKPDRFAKIDALFKLCDKDRLIYVEDPGVELYDDGTHGDVTAKDGIYTLKFINTQYEGSYIFRFKASGISPSGSPFSRVKTMAEYVRVEVDPDQTDFSSRIYQQAGNIVVKEFYVTPRDKFGAYLGPGYPDQIQFNARGGEWISPVIDYNNGIYSRMLKYDRTEGKPIVSAIIQDKPVKPAKEGIPWWVYVLIILITLIIIVWWLIIRRR